MFENRRFPAPHELIGPFQAEDYAATVPLGNNNPTVPRGIMVDQYNQTPLNKAKGAIVPLSNRYEYYGDPFKNLY